MDAGPSTQLHTYNNVHCAPNPLSRATHTHLSLWVIPNINGILPKCFYWIQRIHGQKIIVIERARTCHLLCERIWYYHSISQHMWEIGSSNWTPNSCFSDLSNSLNPLSMKVLLHLRNSLLEIFILLKFGMAISPPRLNVFPHWFLSLRYN